MKIGRTYWIRVGLNGIIRAPSKVNNTFAVAGFRVKKVGNIIYRCKRNEYFLPITKRRKEPHHEAPFSLNKLAAMSFANHRLDYCSFSNFTLPKITKVMASLF
jgi:hypothetical protein